jgi:hypothetical protein
MSTLTKPLSELVQELDLSVKVMKVNSKNKPEWAKQEWLILIACDSRTVSFNYYGGGAVTKPTLTDSAYVLGVEYLPEETSFREWAYDYGYDTDSVKALSDFDSMMARSRELEYLLGSTELAQRLSESAREH